VSAISGNAADLSLAAHVEVASATVLTLTTVTTVPSDTGTIALGPPLHVGTCLNYPADSFMTGNRW
jgi:hypothetical protein